MANLETNLDPAKAGLARKRRKMNAHAAAKLRLNRRRRAGVRAYTLPLKTTDLEAWLRLLGKVPPVGVLEKAEIEAALVTAITEAIAQGR
jgi:hypothetical protein